MSTIGSGLALFAGILAGTARGDLTIQVEASSSNLVGNLAFSFNGHQETNVLAGTLTGSFGTGPTFDAYCIDLYHVIYVGSNTYTVAPSDISGFAQSPPSGYTAAGGGQGAVGGDGPGLGYLFSTFDHQVAAETGNQAVIDGAGLQVALWKMAYDGGATVGKPDLTTGSFQFLDSTDLASNQHLVYAAASRFLSGYDGSQDGPGTFLRVTDHGPNGALYQDLVAGPNISVPEPSSLALGVIGSAFLFGMAARRRLKAAR